MASSSFSLPLHSLYNGQMTIRLKASADGTSFGFDAAAPHCGEPDTSKPSSSRYSLNFFTENFNGCPVLKISASENNRPSTSSPGIIANLHVADAYPPLDGYGLPADAGIATPPSDESSLTYEPSQCGLPASDTPWQSLDAVPKSESFDHFNFQEFDYSGFGTWDTGSTVREDYNFGGILGLSYPNIMQYSTPATGTLPDMSSSPLYSSPAISPSVLSSSSSEASLAPSPQADSPISTTQWHTTVPEHMKAATDSSRDTSPSSESDPPPTRRRKIPCTIPGCTSRFTSQYTLKVHLEAHKPKLRTYFPCTLGCSEKFSRQHDRLRHEVAKHGKVCEFVCSDCRRFFSSERTLRNHRCPVAIAEGKTRWVT